MALQIHTAPPNSPAREVLGVTLPTLLDEAVEKYPNAKAFNQPRPGGGWVTMSNAEFKTAADELKGDGITLNLAAGLGAFAFGFVDDRIGGKKTILISLAGLVLATALAATTTSETMLWVSGTLIGLLIGPNQSASRSLMARFVPRQSAGEFYGLFAFSGKATSFAAPFLLSSLTYWTGSQRVGVASLIPFFVIGGLILLWVDESEGRRFGASEQARLDAQTGRG